MSTTVEEYVPETWDTTPQDVKDLLPHVSFLPSVANSNLHYVQATTGGITDATLNRFIQMTALTVTYHARGYELVPAEHVPLIRSAARDATATGAAHYAQAALFPSSAAPNDGDAYAERLQERFQEALATLAQLIADATAAGRLGARSAVSHTFPAPLFPDGWAG